MWGQSGHSPALLGQRDSGVAAPRWRVRVLGEQVRLSQSGGQGDHILGRGRGGDPTEQAGVQVGGAAFGGLQNSWNVSAGPLPGI